MDKRAFLNIFNSEDSMEASRLFEQINRAFDGAYILGTSFLTPNIWKKIEDKEYLFNEGAIFYGFKDGERKVFASNKSMAEKSVILLSIENQYPKRALYHRDYLGALMALNIDRSKFSDIIINGNKAYFLTLKEISEYIVENLNKVGNNGVTLSIEDKCILENLYIKKEPLTLTVPSNRADVLVSELTNLSRSKSEELISSGNLLINNTVVKEKSFNIKIKDFITIRGYGKFTLEYNLGENKKGKQRISAYKYSS